MDLDFDERESDSPFVETVWRSRSEQSGPFISMADSRSSMVVARFQGKTILTLRGPETHATPAEEHAGAEYFGIRFMAGVFMPHMPANTVMDRRDQSLPSATGRSFWLQGSAWEFPEYENVDTFVDRLVRDNLLVYDPIVKAALRNEPMDLSLRTIQRRFLQATGLSQSTIQQIERARQAVSLLRQGRSILDVTYQAGYFDQPHLTRSLKQFIGLTPAQILNQQRKERLSFLYKTQSPFLDTIWLQNDQFLEMR